MEVRNGQRLSGLEKKFSENHLEVGLPAKNLEEEKYHFQIAGFLDNAIVATAVLVPEGDNMRMQRVVVAENLRSLNIGSEMMTYCEKLASAKNFTVMYCHARDSAVNFYIKNGYTGIGDYFDEDGIPHLKMRKKLLIPATKTIDI